MSFDFPRPLSAVLDRDTRPMSREWRQYLFALAATVNDLRRKVEVVTTGPVWVSLSPAEQAEFFDGTGLGLDGKRFAGWAICNGNNDADDLTSPSHFGLVPVKFLG